MLTDSARPASFVPLILGGKMFNLDLRGFALFTILNGHLLAGIHGLYRCRCLWNDDCAENAYCQNGCEQGSYGPGCQFRNIAHGGNAIQSSTNVGPTGNIMPASLAVDGKYAKYRKDAQTSRCSQTTGREKNPWWQVVIDGDNTYFVDNVTIINVISAEAGRLRNFSIYLSEGIQTYPNGDWRLCAYEPEEAEFLNSYTCIQTYVAKSVAVVQRNELSSYLTLCEVIIGGYDYFACSSARAGPGCKQWSCDTRYCRDYGGTCGPRRTCRYPTCPGSEQLPPECWITLANFEAYEWWTEMTSNEIRITGWPHKQTNWKANALTVVINSQGIQTNYSSRTNYEIASGGYIDIYIGDYQKHHTGSALKIKVIPEFCFEEKMCIEDDCYVPPLCIKSRSSNWLTVAHVEGDTSTTRALPCNCKQGTICTANGYCRAGCASGFFGPGCLLSNVAYKKKVAQSSTFEEARRILSAAAAVDGLYSTDLSDHSAPHCSHTKDLGTNSWWQVFLDRTKKYVISQIILINRVDRAASLLKNFTILITNDTTTYPKGYWIVCAHQPRSAPFSSSYECEPNIKSIARSVAIDLQKDKQSFLVLCEVIIEAYEFRGDCPNGYTGPRCLLRSCAHEDCKDGGKCGPFNSCKFTRCPVSEELPPDCWITFSIFSSYNWMVSSTNKRTNITGVPTIETNLQANFVGVDVFTGGGRLEYTSRNFSFQFGASGAVMVSLETVPNTQYDIRLIPKLCFREKTCVNENICYAKPQCFEGAASQRISVTSGYTSVVSEFDENE